jgi:phosphotransferase family enzyme
MREYPLPGGAVSGVVRIGDTVHRRPGSRAGFVHELLGFFQRAGWPGAPRFLGFDPRGREVLSFVEGHAAWRADAGARVTGEASVVRVAELVREFHDLTAGSPLAGDQEVVCHNDLSPKNTVYRGSGDDGAGLRPAAFIDWDLAAPGRRIHDVAHVCWQFLGLGPGAEVEAARRGIQLICDAYRLDGRDEIVDVIMWWQDRCWRGIEAGADAGDPAMAGLRERGAVRDVRAAWDWVRRHRGELERR